MRNRIPAKAPRHNTCRTLLPVFPVFFMTILLLLCSVPACAEIRMIDQGALLRAYGFPDGQRNILGVIRLNINPEVAEITGAIEGAPNLDSNLEVITAARYGSVRVTPAAQRVINRELPPGPEGDKLLAAAWLERRQKHNITAESCNRALAFISNRSHISVAALRSHYRQTMESRLVAIARREFPPGTPLPETIRPLINYVATFDGRGNLRVNDEALFNELVRSVQNVYNGTSTVAFTAYMQTVDSVSNELGARIHRNLRSVSVGVMSPLNNNGPVVAQDIRAGR